MTEIPGGDSIGVQLAAIGQVDLIYVEKPGPSGRPQFKSLLQNLSRDDRIIVYSMSVLASSVLELNAAIEEVSRAINRPQGRYSPCRAQVKFVKESITLFVRPSHRKEETFRNLIATLARFEHDALTKRRSSESPAALSLTKDPNKRRKLSSSAIRELRVAASKGESKAALARTFRISRATLYRYLA